MDTDLEFNRVTFGLPVETFRFDAYIAMEERLPVVTEYVLRLIRICGGVPLSALRDYFGFSDSETLSITESLSRQGLLVVEDDEARLSQFAAEKFDLAGDEHPRFSKVELRNDVVSLDLLTFMPLKSTGRETPTDNIIKLEASDEAVGNSIEQARTAYYRRYPEIASMRNELQEKSFGVYSIESVESKSRTYFSVPVSFLLDSDGQVQRRFDEVFERNAPPELIHEVTEKVTAAIPHTSSLESPGLDELIQMFNIQVLGRYLMGNKFDLRAYLTAVHLTKTVKLPKGTKPLFGNLYLPENREHILRRLKRRRHGHQNQGKLSTSLAWLVPDYHLWGRGEALAETVTQVTEILRHSGSSDDLFLCAYAERDDQRDIVNRYRVKQLKELHFGRPLFPDKKIMEGRLEILLYPTAFVFVMYHLSLPGGTGLWAPLGFVSTLPKHLDVAHKLICKALGGSRYGGRAQFNQRDKRPQPQSFEDGLPFLNYESVFLHSVQLSDDIEEE